MRVQKVTRKHHKILKIIGFLMFSKIIIINKIFYYFLLYRDGEQIKPQIFKILLQP